MKEKINKAKNIIIDKYGTFKKTRWFSFVRVLLIIAVCIGIGLFIAFYQHANNPTNEGSAYLRAFIAQDYETMYKLLYNKDGKIDKKKYINKMKSLRQTYQIDSYDIGKVQTKDGTEYITMICKDDRTKEKKEFTVYFAKEGFLNPKFYVDLSKVNEDEEMMANEYQIRLSRSSDNVLGKYYTSVRNKDFGANDLLNLFKNKNVQKKRIRKLVAKDYKKITSPKKDKKKRKYTIKDITISNPKRTYKYDSKKKQFTVTYDFQYKYVAATKISVSNSYVYKKKGKQKATMTMVYDFDGDKLSLVGFSLKNKKK